MSRVLITRVDSEGVVSSLILAGHTIGLYRDKKNVVHLFLDVASRGINYNRETDLGLRVEYVLNGKWGEYYSTGIFSRHLAEVIQDAVDAIGDCERPIEEFTTSKEERTREVQASEFLNPSWKEYRGYLAHFLDTNPDQTPMSYKDWMASYW